MPAIDLPDQLLSLHTAKLTERNDTYMIEIRSRELHRGDLQRGGTYKVALLPASPSETDPDPDQFSAVYRLL